MGAPAAEAAEKTVTTPLQESDVAYASRHEKAYPGATPESVLARDEVKSLYFNTKKGFNREFHKLAYEDRFDQNTGEPMNGVSPENRVASRMLFTALKDLQQELGIAASATESDGIPLRQFSDTDAGGIDRKGRYARVQDLTGVLKKRISALEETHPGVDIEKKFDEDTGMKVPHDSLQYYLRLKFACDISDCDNDIRDSRSSSAWRMAKLARQERRMTDEQFLTLGQSLAQTEREARKIAAEQEDLRAQSVQRSQEAAKDIAQQQQLQEEQRANAQAVIDEKLRAIIEQAQNEAAARATELQARIELERARLDKDLVNPHAVRITQLETEIAELEAQQHAYAQAPLAV